MCNHGMGQPSASILFHEITKLLHYAGAEDVEYFRMGTSGMLISFHFRRRIVYRCMPLLFRGDVAEPLAVVFD